MPESGFFQGLPSHVRRRGEYRLDTIFCAVVPARCVPHFESELCGRSMTLMVDGKRKKKSSPGHGNYVAMTSELVITFV
jgi:hypothetical protein